MRLGIFVFCFAACAGPDLGDIPFLCGDQGSCPSGYTCMQDLCVRDGVQLPTPDAAMQPQDANTTMSTPDAPAAQPDAARPDAQAIPDAARNDAAPLPDARSMDATVTPDAAGGGACQRSSECGAGLCCGWATNTCVSP